LYCRENDKNEIAEKGEVERALFEAYLFAVNIGEPKERYQEEPQQKHHAFGQEGILIHICVQD